MAKKSGKDKKKKKNREQVEVTSKTMRTVIDVSPKFILEERLRTIFGIVLFLLFLVLFGAVVWYFLTQLDTTFVSGTAGLPSFF